MSQKKICSPILNYAFALKKTCVSYILNMNIKYRGKAGSRKHFFKKSWNLMFFYLSISSASTVTSSPSTTTKTAQEGTGSNFARGNKKFYYSVLTLNATGDAVLLLSHGRLTVSKFPVFQTKPTVDGQNRAPHFLHCQQISA